MLELRLFIAFIGLIVLGLIYYFGTRKKPSDRSQLNEMHDIKEPYLGDHRPADPVDPPVSTQQRAPEVQSSGDKIVTIFLHARDGLQFDWHQIKEAAEKAGLEYGEDNLYYRYRQIGGQKDLIFLVANMLKPGYFQPDMRTTGLAFIMTLPGIMDALEMWDTLFPVAERLEKLLDGRLTDENHNAFSRQRIASMREEMRQFESRHGAI